MSLRNWYGAIVDQAISALWGTHTFVVLLGVGLLFTIWSRFVQYRALTHGVQVLRGKYDDERDPGAISHFQALSAALSGTVGLGNIGGVALAIGLGGPGALFWMWMAGFFGMAIKSVEVTLAMMYRDTSERGNPHGGAMWVVTRGIGDRFGDVARPLAWIAGAVFCVTLLISTVTGGNMFQAWNVANITNEYFGIPQVASGIALSVLTALVIIGGVTRIGVVAGRLVPFMCGLYLIAGMIVLVHEAANIPALLLFIVRDAFSPAHASGAFLGATAWFGLTTGLRRALFSNEAGQGSSPIAHAAARTDEPVRVGVVAGLEPFIDTCVVCTLTALVILATGTWNREAVGRFNGPIEIVQTMTGARVDASVTLNALPALVPPDSWEQGNGFFLLAEMPQSSPTTGDRRVKITGRIAIADLGRSDVDAPGNLVIRWDEPPRGARLVSTGVYRDFTGAALTGHAFDRSVPGLGKWLVTVACWLFALSTIISWSYYGEQGMVFLFGKSAVVPYKVIYCALTVVACLPEFIRSDVDLGNLADLGTGVMLFANLPIILALSYQSMRAFDEYFARMRRGDTPAPREGARGGGLAGPRASGRAGSVNRP